MRMFDLTSIENGHTLARITVSPSMGVINTMEYKVIKFTCYSIFE